MTVGDTHRWRLLWASVGLLLGAPAYGHVSLLYPPARQYALDFLDNARTIAPCGMPKGPGPKTTWYSGQWYNITWHLGYPHQGGVHLDLLDASYRRVYMLTEPGWLTGDTTRQTLQVQIPLNLTCSNCTVQLTRQAQEWGPRYTFWSCADVDILPETQFVASDCPEHSQYDSSRGLCRCDYLYSGSHCQYKDVCLDDGDCLNGGICREVQLRPFVRHACYCAAGFMGDVCQTDSPLAKRDVDFSGYKRTDLSNNVQMYHKLLPETEEIEVAVTAPTVSWLGIGFRAQGRGTTCQFFPVPRGSLLSSQSPVAEPESEPEPTGEPQHEPTGEPQHEPTGEPQHEPTGEPQHEPTGEPHYEPTGEPHYEPTGEPHYEPTGEPHYEPTGEPHYEPTGEPHYEPTGEPHYEPTGEPHYEPTGEPHYEPTREPDHEPTGEPHYEPTGEPHHEPTGEPHHEPTGEPHHEPTGEPTSEPEGEPWLPRLHPMDCTDMVIGSGYGSRGRVADYYTRDRSTPQPDSFYGYTDSLTGATAFESGGSTFVIFRRKLRASEPTDVSITNAPVHVIWAMGQRQGSYVHIPRSGLEGGKASVQQFYRDDELKYHGHRSQRGHTTVNFLETDDNTGPVWTGSRVIQGRGPVEFKVTWQYRAADDALVFGVSLSAPVQPDQTWFAIGFSDDTFMANSDILMATGSTSGRWEVTDRWAAGYILPQSDNTQNILSYSFTSGNNATAVRIERLRQTSDSRDFQFTASNCPYLMFAVGGYASGRPLRHYERPIVSTQRVCVYSPDSGEVSGVSVFPPSVNEVVSGTFIQDVVCSANCADTCSFSWTRDSDGAVISNSPVLSLGFADNDDMATYTCTVTSLGGKSASKQFFVHPKIPVNGAQRMVLGGHGAAIFVLATVMLWFA